MDTTQKAELVEEILARDAASREWHYEDAEGVRLHMRLPDKFDVQVETARAAKDLDTEPGPAELVIASRALFERAIVGWEGVKVKHLLASAREEEGEKVVPFDPKLVRLFVNHSSKIAQRVREQMRKRMDERDGEIEETTKNSESGSPSS